MRVRWALAVGSIVGAASGGCILPDRDIQILSADVNRSPVKLIEPVGLSLSQHCACDPGGCDEEDPPTEWTGECDLPPPIELPHFMNPVQPEYQFCKCQEGTGDSRGLPGVEFYAEDQDSDPDADEPRPRDTLFAAILLDAAPEDNPTTKIVYDTVHRPPTIALPDFPGFGYEAPSDTRPRPFVRRIPVKDAVDKWDLCNGDPRVEPGFRTITLLVTDRPWFQYEDPSSGDVVLETGVVDIAAGATYDTTSYTFYCSSTDDPNNPVIPGDGGDEPHDPFGCAERCQEPGG
jgi:hypothetical protein